MLGRVPASIVIPVIPKRAIEVMLREPDFFARVLGQGVEDSVVREEGFKFAAKRLALYPVDHIAAIGRP